MHTQGNVTFSNYVESTYIGLSHIQNLVLRPGNNTVTMRSAINQTLVAEKLLGHQDGMLPITVVGNQSVYDGQRLRYFEDALKSQPLNVTLDIGSALGGLTGKKKGRRGLSRRRDIKRRLGI